MDQSWEIIGIVLAILMVIIGLRLLLKKSEPLPTVKMDELPIEQDTQQPIVPRTVRENIISSTEKQHMIPASSSQNEEKNITLEPTIVQEEKLEHSESASPAEIEAVEKELLEESELVQEAQELLAKNEQETALSDNNPILDAVDVVQEDMQPIVFKDDDILSEATVLDAHLSEQDRVDEESALATAQKIVALYMYPNPERALSGERTLKMLLKYGLRYGEMSCFHRYEHPEHPSSLMFSVLRIDNDGAPTGFDLEALPTDEVRGLAFFLALPSPNAVQGFDMMTSIAGLIARDTEGLVFDEQSLELTPQLREHWRHFVIEYDPEQAKHLD